MYRTKNRRMVERESQERNNTVECNNLCIPIQSLHAWLEAYQVYHKVEHKLDSGHCNSAQSYFLLKTKKSQEGQTD